MTAHDIITAARFYPLHGTNGQTFCRFDIPGHGGFYCVRSIGTDGIPSFAVIGYDGGTRFHIPGARFGATVRGLVDRLGAGR